MALILASLRGIDHAARDMATGTWNHIRRSSLADSTVVIVGAGGVARAIARRLEPCEVSTTLVGRTARDGVEGMHSLSAYLSTADVVVIAVPLDASTQHMVNAEFLATMRDGALLVNVSRGGVVNQNDLLAETASGRLFAALDVTDPEPLPSDHPLWRSPGVLITPHVGGDSTAFVPRGQHLVSRQSERWSLGEPLINIIEAR
jgi:phosphoglycerate dehydrogenase-like enzyme